MDREEMPPNEGKIPRREFLKDATKVVGVTVLGSTLVSGISGEMAKEVLKSMEDGAEFNPQKDIKKAQKVEDKREALIDDPIARTNLSLFAIDKEGKKIRLNEDWQPTPEAQKAAEEAARKGGYTPLRLDRTPTPEILRDIKKGEKVKDPQTGQELNVLRLNWDKFKEGERVLVFLPAYNDSIEKGAINYRLQELARQTGLPTLSIDFPQMGGSADLTEGQKRALIEDSSYREIAEAQLRVMKSLGINNIDIVGISMGGWAAAEVARSAKDLGVAVGNVTVIDSPGVADFDSRGFLDELSKKELGQGKYVDLYQSRPYSPEMRKASGQDNSEIKKKINSIRWLLSSFKNDPDGVYKKAMAKKTLPQTLKEALSKNPDLKVTVVNGTISPVSPAEANREMVRGLNTDFKGRVRQVILPGEPHLVMENATRFAPTIKMILETSS